MKPLFTFIFSFLALFSFAQVPTQTVRGQIVDNQTKSELVGAIVLLADTGVYMRNTTTDVNGNFRFENVSVGRHLIVFKYSGYKERSMPIIVTSGKETVLNIEMEESVIQNEEVVITDESEKTKPNNEMTTVSARSFTIEETSRYAGSLGDPSRMAQNYAGVSGADDSRNDVVIRGNSPLGVLWRLNGADIPNPNHFGSFGSTGGPVSMLNNNILDNSDFMTSAFPAEYGNAIAGVFDLKMRNGNNEKFEFLGQVGFNGFEAGMEGPFTKKHNASFLVDYRFSSLTLFEKMGADFGIGDAVPKYQDLSFKLNFP
ncbi:MAG TPA: TonB-dependent receptor, partial [Bacteroidia bacterium]|nr:TonB-dependent receptor [Bacteroidia bacterium]